jgi:hypothetical protein
LEKIVGLILDLERSPFLLLNGSELSTKVGAKFMRGFLHLEDATSQGIDIENFVGAKKNH